jgi:branched-chain amino acid transport system ATP-binding protein
MRRAEPLLRVEGVSKVFDGLTAVNDVSLAVEAGEICGVIGPNGAGKSTLFNLVSGALPVTSGRILFDGADVTRASLHHRARLGIARTFQLAHTFDSMSVAANVLVGAEHHARLSLVECLTHLGGYRRSLAEARGQADAAMAITGIAGIAHLPGSQLTFGQQRLVATARALASRPRLLLLDEPAAGLSQADIGFLDDAVLRARDAGAGVLIVEHNMELVMRLCDRIVVMHLGEKIGDGAPSAIRQSRSVIEAYLGS